MGERDDGLGLSLSLSLGLNQKESTPRLNPTPMASYSSSSHMHMQNSWIQMIQSSGTYSFFFFYNEFLIFLIYE